MITGASDLNQTINSTTAPDAPGDWAQREQDAVDKSKLPPGMDESIFNALLASPLYKDLQDIEEIVNSTDALKRPGVKGEGDRIFGYVLITIISDYCFDCCCGCLHS